MKIDIITTEDLRQFKIELLQEMKGIISQGRESQQNGEWLRSAQVRKMLNISPGTLQNLRINGTLPFRKIGGTMYYSKAQIEKILKGE
ncbi:helix-turn-helix domain-containing protein [Pedobacter sp. MC2016-24]|uniref:helix-turn-helix domain-containing protein n=1 Tax=Pedobacter sp. MC2016-24 TaxID=2780090 RepID=UPI00187DF708|nr:helix-turn-helix domain-containing protein [Pedobacter sp. MC2016-24]MBE9597859.1 helix-turn-helix domain-containing protein [Pedobacter sp. MC2016-24]